MRGQETYLELKRGDDSINVVKTYDAGFAREAFDSMDDTAVDVLASSLRLEENFDLGDIPNREASEYDDFLWEALVEAAQEDGHIRSYFVVETKSSTNGARLAFVSPDWPCAEGYAKSLAAPPQTTA